MDTKDFLQDVFEELVKLPGDPLRQFEHAVQSVLNTNAEIYRDIARQHRIELLEMAEERKKNPHAPVRTRWANYNYDRRG